MEVNILLSKCITLLYRESQLENITDNSVDMVRTAIEEIRPADVQLGTPNQKDLTTSLKDLVLEMCRTGPSEGYDESELLQQVRILAVGEDNLYQAIEKSIEGCPDQANLKRTITNLRKSLTNYFKDQKLAKVISKAYRDINFQRHNITDRTEYFQNLIAELEVNLTPTTGKDPAVIYSLDIGDDGAMAEIYTSVQQVNEESEVYKFGWQELNDALQGGARPGDCVFIGANRHNYKTGVSLTMFADLALFNKPKTKDPNKKPLLYRATMEDPVRNNAQFLYLYLKYNETGEYVNTKNTTFEEMARYVKQRLQVNGFHVLIEEINPSDWTYRKMINKIVELESKGYSVEAVSLDYMYKMSKEGCTQGASGDDTLDLTQKLKSYFSANRILWMTPHQFDTATKSKIATIPADQLLPTIKGTGPYEAAKGLDRIYDIGIMIHKVETPNGDYLHMLLDKHRFPVAVANVYKQWFLPFPKDGMPIKYNIHQTDHKPLRRLPRTVSSNQDESLFS